MSDSIPILKVHPPKQEDTEKDRGEGEGEEKTEAVGVEEEHAPAPELTSMSQLKEEPQHGSTGMEDGQTAAGEQQKDEEEDGEKDAMQGAGAEADSEGGGTEASKGISKVQSVFALVRNRVRSQSSADWSQGRGILGVVQQATWDLVKAQGGRPAAETSQESSSSGADQGSREGDGRGSPVVMERGPEGEGTPETEQDLEIRESKLEGKGGRGGGGQGGEEVLRSMEALRQDLKEEITRLRLDTQLALAGLEARLTHSLRTHANSSATLAKQPAATEMGSAHGGAERRPRPPVIVGATTAAAVPSCHGVRRRALYRTLTTLTSTTCPPPPLLPRSRSEPMGGRVSLACRPSNGVDTAGRLPPPQQHTRKPLRLKTRQAKPDSG